MNSVNFQSRLRRNFSGSVNFQAVFSSDSVNVAGPLSKTATKSMSQPILFSLFSLESRSVEFHCAEARNPFSRLKSTNINRGFCGYRL